MHIVYILLAMLLWGFVHSLTASLTLKEKAAQTFGSGFMRLYRLLFNGFSLLTFLPIMGLVAALPYRILYIVPAPWTYLMFGGQALSILLLALAFLQTDWLHFIGVRQLFQEDTQGELTISGLYRIVRHPLYTFSLTLLWLNPYITDNTLVFYIGATAYLIIGAYFEERKLLREFGVAYANYKKTTAMIIPWLI
jgi:protein-S-isoprenylcysteine O-methyltransferase Ste14